MNEQVRNQCHIYIRFEPLVSQACDSDELIECLSGNERAQSGLDVQLVGDRIRALGGSVRDRRLKVGTWNFSVSVNKKKIGKVLDKNTIDVVAGQES